ncbi:MAG: S8 family peptidase [Elusimicrobia bacterium]|nr:S8 family peptidase [Elusimicrobiota bacterium]
MLKIRTALALLALGLAGPAGLRADTQAEQAPVRKIVVFAAQTPAKDRVLIAESAGAKVVRTLEMIHAVVIEGAPQQVVLLQARLRSRPEVVRIDDDPRIKWINAAPARISDIPLPDIKSVISPFKASAPVRRAEQSLPWGIPRVNAPKAWAAARGKGVKIAVIDTGVDFKHPDLASNVKGGWNAISKNGEFLDDHGHGTHVAGSIAALDNAEGVVGVAPEASIYGVKVLDSGGSGTFSDVIAGMQWAWENKMDIASMSLGASQGNDSFKEAVEAMVAGGTVLIAAAGNSGGWGDENSDTVNFPAGYPGAIAIAASDSQDAVAWFSSRGPEVDFIAPGVDVPSTYMGGGYQSLSGTSMATPHVSGLAALAISAKRLRGEPAVRAALKAASLPLPNATPNQQGAGMIDAAKLVQ